MDLLQVALHMDLLQAALHTDLVQAVLHMGLLQEALHMDLLLAALHMDLLEAALHKGPLPGDELRNNCRNTGLLREDMQDQFLQQVDDLLHNVGHVLVGDAARRGLLRDEGHGVAPGEHSMDHHSTGPVVAHGDGSSSHQRSMGLRNRTLPSSA